MLSVSPDEARRRLEENRKLDWYHKFEVSEGSGVFTPGRLDTQGYQWRRSFVGLTPEFLRGKRVLDIGAYSGAFTFLLQDLGAEVVAADVADPARNGFALVNELRGGQVRHVRRSVYDLDPEEIGTFDIVALYGVHYHLRHPLLALERCNAVCKDGGLFIGGGTGLDRWFHDDDPSCARGVNLDLIAPGVPGATVAANELALSGFAPNQFLRDKSNWFIPNLTCLLAWVSASGFEVTDSHKNARPIDRSWNMDQRIQRTSLNFISRKVGAPTPEYTYDAMAPFRIPTITEVERLQARVTELESRLARAEAAGLDGSPVAASTPETSDA